MTSNQSTGGRCLRMCSKWAARRPTPKPRLGCPSRGEVMMRLLRRRGSTGLGGGGAGPLAGLGHGGLEVLARLGPGFVAQRDAAIALALAGVLAGVLAAAALALALVVRV